MASQSLNNSGIPVLSDHAAEEPINGRNPHHQDDTEGEVRDVHIDHLSEADFEGMIDSGLAYSDHDYIGSNPYVRCPPETAKFPVMGGVTEQYLNGETSDPCAVEKSENSFTGTAPSIAATSSGIRKPQIPGGTVFRPVKGEEFAHAGSHQLQLQSKSVTFKNVPNVTQPKKSGRPPKNEGAGDRLMGRAMIKAGIQTHGQMQSIQHHVQGMHVTPVQELGHTIRGTAPIVTPARGQKVITRGRPAGQRRELVDDGSGGYPLIPSQTAHAPPYRPISPAKMAQFRSAQAAEEAHTREMMEAAQNALAPVNTTLSGQGVIISQQSQHSYVLPMHQDRMDEGDLPKTPGRDLPLMASPSERRSFSESQDMNTYLLHEPLRTNPDGMPVTPGGGRKTPQRSRMSFSESTGSSSQAASPQRPSSSSRHSVMQSRAHNLSPHRSIHPGGQLKSPPGGPNLPLAPGPSTMASAQMQMSSNAPMPSLHNQSYQQTGMMQRMGGASGRAYYDAHGTEAAPLITAGNSSTYIPRRRKDKDIEESVQAEVSKNVKTILQAEKSQRRSTTSSHTLSPRNEGIEEEEIYLGKHVGHKKDERKSSTSKKTQKHGKRLSKQSSRDEDESEEEKEVEWIISCICGQKEDDGEEMVACDECKVRWEHVDCIFPETKKAPAGSYLCHVCWPRPTDLTPAQARAYQDRVKVQKEEENDIEMKRKLAERAKKREENSRKPSSSASRSAQHKGNALKQEKPTACNFREIQQNEYSNNAKRLMNVSRKGGGLPADVEILKLLKNTPRVRSLFVEERTHGLVATQEISSGSYLAELCGYICTAVECSNRDAPPGVLNDTTFLFEKDGTKIIIDARKMGNFARYVRRSCKPNAELQEIVSGTELHVMIKAKDGIEFKPMEEISIKFEDEWRARPRPAQGCTCKGEDLNTCEIELFFNKPSKVQDVHGGPSTSRRSLPTNGTTPKGVRSPNGRAVTEKKNVGSTKKVIAKKTKKKGNIKLSRHSRKPKGGSATTENESEGDDDTEKEYEDSTADEKEKEDIREKIEEKASRRERKNMKSTSSNEKTEKEAVQKEEESKPILTPTRSSARMRTYSEAKKEMEVTTKEDKINNESDKSKKGGRRSIKDVDIHGKKEEIKEEIESHSTKKTKKPWPTMDYTLPSERNKPSREERKLQALIKQAEKSEKKGKRGRPPGSGSTAPAKEEKDKGRGKRKSEIEDEAARADTVTAAASTPIVQPPKKKWADYDDKKIVEDEPRIFDTCIASTSKDDVIVHSPAPSGMKKKLLHRHLQEQREKEERAAEAASTSKGTVSSSTSTPIRSKRLNKKEERGAIEALLNIGGEYGGKGGIRQEMRDHAIQLGRSLRTSIFSPGKTKKKERDRCASGPVPLPPPPPQQTVARSSLRVPSSSFITPLSHDTSVEWTVEKSVKKTSLSLDEYKKRKQTGGTAIVTQTREEKEKKEEPPKKSFMPSVGASTSIPSSLPHVNLPGLDETVGIDELKRRVYGDTSLREGKEAASSSTASSISRNESAPKRISINERLKNEFSLPNLSSHTAHSVATPSTSCASVPIGSTGKTTTSSISHVPTRYETTPTGRIHKNRLSDAKAMNVEPPGLIEMPLPSSHIASTTSTRMSSSTSAPSSTTSSFFQRAGSIRSTK